MTLEVIIISLYLSQDYDKILLIYKIYIILYYYIIYYTYIFVVIKHVRYELHKNIYHYIVKKW